MVAAADISAGDTVLEEDDGPFVACPNLMGSVAVCVECFAVTEASPKEEEKRDEHRCSRCRYPLCKTCQKGGSLRYHDEEECAILSACVERASEENRRKFFLATGKRKGAKGTVEEDEFGATYGNSSSNNSASRSAPDTTCEAIYSSLGPLRLLLSSERRPERYREEISGLLDHSEERRRRDPRGWALAHAIPAGFLRGACKLADRFEAEDVHRAVGILRTNGVRLDPLSGSGGPGGLGLFTAYALVNHSCVPNVRTLKDGRRSLRVVATVNIGKGEEIRTRYITPQFDTARRQSMLQGHWHFRCRCRRCEDPTECGSMLGAIRCRRRLRQGSDSASIAPSSCPGYLLPDCPHDPTSADWTCKECGASVRAREAEVVVRVAEERIRYTYVRVEDMRSIFFAAVYELFPS